MGALIIAADQRLYEAEKNRSNRICGVQNRSTRDMNGQNRSDIKIGGSVKIVLKADQRTGKLTVGTVARILTNSATHPHGIKVMLTDGQVGRVQEIV